MADEFIKSELSAFHAKFAAGVARASTQPKFAGESVGPKFAGESDRPQRAVNPGVKRIELTLTKFSTSSSSSDSEDEEPIAPAPQARQSATPLLDRLIALGKL